MSSKINKSFKRKQYCSKSMSFTCWSKWGKTFPDDIDTCQYKSITGTMKLHQVTNKVSLKSGISIRNLICTCIPCQDHIWHICLKRTISRKSHFNGTILGVYKKKTVTIWFPKKYSENIYNDLKSILYFVYSVIFYLQTYFRP